LNDNANSLLQLANEHFVSVDGTILFNLPLFSLCILQVEPSWNKANLIEEVENIGFFGSNYIEIIVKDWFLIFEGAKAMPFFKELDTHDQVKLDAN
jgi:hypothetical protein